MYVPLVLSPFLQPCVYFCTDWPLTFRILVDFCAECLASFIQDHYTNEDGSVLLDKDIALGFTFSYPCVCVTNLSDD